MAICLIVRKIETFRVLFRHEVTIKILYLLHKDNKRLKENKNIIIELSRKKLMLYKLTTKILYIFAIEASLILFLHNTINQ